MFPISMLPFSGKIKWAARALKQINRVWVFALFFCVHLSLTVLNERSIPVLHVFHLVEPPQGLKKVRSSHLGLVYFSAAQLAFHSHLPDGKGPRQVVCQQDPSRYTKTCPLQSNFKSCNCPKFHFFQSLHLDLQQQSE